MATINPMTNNMLRLITERPAEGLSGQAPSGAAAEEFGNVFAEAFKTASEADAADKAGTVELLSGGGDDMSGLLLDAQKAELALSLALQMRTKVLDAYNEIMRMQV